MKRNRITALLLTAVMLNGMSACGSRETEPEPGDSGSAAASSEQAGESASEPDAEPGAQETEELPEFTLADILAPTNPDYLVIPFVEEPHFTAGKQISKITKDHRDDTGGGVDYYEEFFFNEQNQLESYRVTERAVGSLAFLETINYEYNEEGKPVSATHNFPRLSFDDQKFFVENIVKQQGIYKHSYPGYVDPDLSRDEPSPAAAAQDNPPIEAIDEFDEDGLKTQTTVTYMNGDTRVFTFKYSDSGGVSSHSRTGQSERINGGQQVEMMDEAGNNYPITDEYSYSFEHRNLIYTHFGTIYGKCVTQYTYNEDGTIHYIVLDTHKGGKQVCTYQFDENGNPDEGEIRKPKRAATSAAPAVTTTAPPRDPSAPAVTTEPHSDLDDIDMSDYPAAVLSYSYQYREGADSAGEE
ncbi:MAG: hypothetical protein IJ060_10475 [Oscillospiraceae bacterium]|nr:hypothetical protein [Oscillospiraceae bacterium]